MKRKFLLISALILLIAGMARGQVADSTVFWEEKPVYLSLKSGYETENVIGISYDERTEYFHNQESELQMIHALHRRIRLLTDDAVNGFNKLSVSLSEVVEVMDIKARVIKPDGRIVEFNKENIREIVDPESKDYFKIFAIDGIEKGDDLEYLIIRKMKGSNFGRAYFQFTFPVLNASFGLISPQILKYAAKGYNGFPQPVAGMTEDGKNTLTCRAENIAGLPEERYFYQNPGRARVEYKLEHNFSRGKGSLLKWSDAAQRIYDIIYGNVDSKALQKWLKTIDTGKGTSFEKASEIEEYIKSNIRIDEGDRPEFADLEYVRTRKVTNEKGAVRIYANLFRALNIKHEIVLTSERSQVKFDPDFQSWNYLSKYLVYLPDDDVYIDPAADLYRIGCVLGELTASHGLFISIVKIGDFESGIGKIKYIEPAPYKANYDNMYIEISTNSGSGVTRITSTRGLKGLSGGYIGRIYENLDEQRKQELLKSVMESKASNPDYSKLMVLEKTEIDFINDAEFIIFSDLTTSSLLEMAGNKLLLNFGEIIGPQVELYSEENKERSAESEFNRWYYRRLVFKVPEGYKILNPEVSDMNISGQSDGETVFGFVSTHTYSGDTYTVDIDEFYRKIFIEPSEFNGFRNVVNAAANFNKAVLILEKL
jgi:hypothetical protein